MKEEHKKLLGAVQGAVNRINAQFESIDNAIENLKRSVESLKTDGKGTNYNRIAALRRQSAAIEFIDSSLREAPQPPVRDLNVQLSKEVIDYYINTLKEIRAILLDKKTS